MSLNKETIEIDSLVRNINKLLKNYTKKHLLCSSELTIPRFHTLWFISKLEPVNMSELNKNIMVSNSTLTITVDHLVEERFVERHRDKNDRRVVLLKSTARGKKHLDDILKKRQKFFQKSLEYLTLEEQNQMISLLKVVEDNLITNYNQLGKKEK